MHEWNNSIGKVSETIDKHRLLQNTKSAAWTFTLLATNGTA